MIKPTIGRKVWFRATGASQAGYANYNPAVPFDATVVYVWSDRCVNLRVTDHAGASHSETSVPLLQDDDSGAGWSRYAEWMPYQQSAAGQRPLPSLVGGQIGSPPPGGFSVTGVVPPAHCHLSSPEVHIVNTNKPGTWVPRGDPAEPTPPGATFPKDHP